MLRVISGLRNPVGIKIVGIFIKMLNDVGMAVPNTRETRVVYTCHKIMTYNNNTMWNPIQV